MAITLEDLEMIAPCIVHAIEEEFAVKHMSMNLVNTMTLEMNDNSVRLVIPAQTYNMKLFQNKGVVVHTSHGSYASKLDYNGSEFYIYPNEGRKGSFLIKPHNHKHFIDKAIEKALQNVNNVLHNRYMVGKITNL